MKVDDPIDFLRRVHEGRGGAEQDGQRGEGKRTGEGDAKGAPEPTTWQPIDLTAALAGADVEPLSIMRRSDGVCLLYRGRIHAFQGESESLKSWAAQFAVQQVIAGGEDVLYVDFEDDAAGVVARLLALGLATEEIAAHLVYIRPEEPLRTHRDEATPGAADLATVLASRRFALAVIDGVTESMTTEGLDLLSNADIAVWMRRLPRRIAREGPAVLLLDHLAKARESQGRYAIGGQHKLAGLTGAAFKFTATKYLSRATGTAPVEGRVVLTVEKDRPGHVRGHAIDDRIAEFVVTSHPGGAVTAALLPPGSAADVDLGVVRRILLYLEQFDGSSKNKVEGAVEGKASAIRDAIGLALARGWVRVERKGVSHLLWITEAGRAEVGTSGTRSAE